MSTASGSGNTDEIIKRLMQKQMLNEMRRAYFVVPPDFMTSIPMVTEPFEAEPIKFRPYMDYGVKMMGFPIITSRFMDFGPSSAPCIKPVVWKDVPKPAIVPAWQWCVVVAYLAWLLVAMGNML